MRYINGTWLKEHFEAAKEKGQSVSVDDVLKLIDEAPTAECFTCGVETVEDDDLGSIPTITYMPEDVPMDIIESCDRPVSLAAVCKLIKSEYEISPYFWVKLRNLPSTKEKEKEGTWEFRMVEDDECIWTRRRFYCSACGRWNTYGKSDFCPVCGAKMRNTD